MVILAKVLKPTRRVAQFFKSIESKMKEQKQFTVVVEGNIGCGKTTFLEYFKKFEQRVEVLTEPVHRWRDVNGHNLLGLMYEDPQRWVQPSNIVIKYVTTNISLSPGGPCHFSPTFS